MRSLFPYVGGKHRVADRLAALLPEHKCYVEVFMGAANVLFAKPPSDTEVINDINGDLVNLFRIIRWHPVELLDELSFMIHSRKDFNDYIDQPGLTDIQRAARYWFRLRTTFGGQGSCGKRNFAFGTTRKAMARQAGLEVIAEAHQRLDGVFVENDDFEIIIKRYDRPYTLFFCDPPYWDVQAGYGRPFEWADHQRLEAALRKIKGKFILTINDHKDIRELFKGLCCRRVKTIYTVCKSETQHVTELVIANFELPKKPW